MNVKNNPCRFTAEVNIIDRDYNSFAGTESFQVHSWNEAVNICRSKTWTGEKYMLDYLVDNNTRKLISSKQEYDTLWRDYEK